MQQNQIKKQQVGDKSDFVKKADLVSLKSDFEKLYVDKLVTVPSDLKSLKSKIDNLDVDKLKTVLQSIKMFFKNQNITRIN